MLGTPMNQNNSLGAAVLAKRSELKCTQQQLARLLDISAKYVSAIELGRSVPPAREKSIREKLSSIKSGDAETRKRKHAGIDAGKVALASWMMSAKVFREFVQYQPNGSQIFVVSARGFLEMNLSKLLDTMEVLDRNDRSRMFYCFPSPTSWKNKKLTFVRHGAEETKEQFEWIRKEIRRQKPDIAKRVHGVEVHSTAMFHPFFKTIFYRSPPTETDEGWREEALLEISLPEISCIGPIFVPLLPNHKVSAFRWWYECVRPHVLKFVED